MQNKGVIKLLAIVLALACLYQLSFTFVASNVEKKAAEYAAQFDESIRDNKTQAYLDSIKSKTVYNLGLVKYTYNEVKEKELNLGLDLKGGMNVMLEISVADVINALSNDSQDPAFRQALDLTKQQVINTNDDFITVFARNYDEISNGSPLAYIFNNQTLREKVSPNSSNEEVIRVLREETESTIASSYNVLRNRIDRFGVTQPNIQRLDNGGRILVELPGVKEPERVRKLLQGTASLEFWATYDNSQIYPVLENANAIIAQLNQASEQISEVEAEEETVAEESSELIDQIADDAANADSEAFAKAYPLFSKLSPLTDQTGNLMAGPIVGYAMSYDTAAVNAYLAIPQVKALFPRDLKLMWGVKAIDEAETIFELYAIKANTRDGKAPLDGSVVVEAREEYSQYSSNAEVSMVMNATGSRTWARLTADNIGQCIAIALDGYVYSAPRVNQEITGGRSSITGDFTIQEATDLANVLKSG
ncbi:MAG: protein translocase subunit SecDF, partial [Tidjanibacter sp.]|nr:protein translocase subunit SecDF [Tidjanibacter sp.]